MEDCPETDENSSFVLPLGFSALILNTEGTHFAVRTALCPHCQGAECGIPPSLLIVTTLATLMEKDAAFRSWIHEQYLRIAEGTYLPIDFRDDVH